MKFLADENFPGHPVRELRARGYDVSWVSETAPSIEDSEILAWAQRESRAILTLDTDFGKLVFAGGHLAVAGVILFRRLVDPRDITKAILQVLDMDIEIKGSFIVVERDRVRVRR